MCSLAVIRQVDFVASLNQAGGAASWRSSTLLVSLETSLPSLEMLEWLERFVVSCYRGKSTITSLTDLRWYLFSRYQREAENLPPTFAALKYKIFRAHFITMVLRRASVPLQMLPPAINYGWENSEGQLIPIMTNNLPAPMALLEMSACSCKSDCTSNRCKCRKKRFCFHRYVQVFEMLKR